MESRTTLIWLLLLFLATTGCTSDSTFHQTKYPDARQITVATFNIRMGFGHADRQIGPYSLRGHWRAIDSVTEAIRSVDADLIALQEVDGPAQAKKLAKTLNMNFAYRSHPNPWWGVAILSKFPIVDRKTIYLGGVDLGRNALQATINLGGHAISIVSIHRDHRDKSVIAYNALNRYLRSTRDPVILAGDFNTIPSDSKLRLFAGFSDTANEVDTIGAQLVKVVGTWYYPPTRIDYIFIQPKKFRVLDVGIPEQEYEKSSDHRLYFAKLELR